MFEVLDRNCLFQQLRLLPDKKLVFGVLLACLLFNCNASTSATPLSHYFQESWTTRDGLPHNTVNSISQSADGYLWLATWEGAARFNGRVFEVFGRGATTGLPDSGIRTLAKDSQGNIVLAGARGGISKQTVDGWHNWPAFSALINAVVIEDDDATLWLASEGQGLFQQRPDGSRKQFTTEQGLGSDVVHSLLKDKTGRLWIGTGRGLAWLKPDKAPLKIHNVEGLPAVPVFALRQYGNDVLIGTERGLFIFSHGKAQLLSADLANLPVSAILVQDKHIWIGSTDRGLLRFSERGVETLSMAGGLPNNRILSLYLDREKSLWVGTNGGLFRLRDAPFVTYTAESGLAGDYVRAVLAHSDGSVWVGTSQGLSQGSETGFETINLAPASSGQSILSLAEDKDGAVWVGTYTDGALRYHNGVITDKYDRATGLLANEVRAILPDNKEGIWIGTGQGLNFIGPDGIRSFGKAEGLPTPFVMALYQHHDGRLFIGTGGGVAIMQTEGSMTALDFSNLDGAEYAFGFVASPEDDILWMTTDRGLVAYDLQSGQTQIIGRKAGLPFDKVFQTVVDNDHNLWLSSNRGILRLERTQVMQFLAGTRDTVDYELFGESDGMQSAQANGGSMQAATMAADGSVLFATSKGLSIVKPADLKRFSINTPPVVIEGLYVDGAATAQQQGLHLPAGTERLELQFAGLGYIMPQRMQYSTQLIGFDTDWVTRGNNATAEYTNLPPGEYDFLVRAAYPRGDWSENVASFRFVISPYYWQRPGFWLTFIVVTLLLAGFTLRWRLTVLHRREQELLRQVAEKTLELQQQTDYLRAIDKERSTLLDQIKSQAQEFELQARRDALTGLANRRAFDESLGRECARARRTKMPLCLVLLDIDHFKRVNDTFSHSVGDEILKMVADVILRHCREADTVARWGGEEFAILLPDTSLKAAVDICERIRHAVMQIDCSAFSEDLHITASMGIASFADEEQHEKLLSRSDSALYRAKQGGRNRVAS
ncbi:ligand-binding sensor domain-containing diguanylate cyclase [Rheinheimera baltica]|uniref:ligand-binding sensor domain-containing diguanylate cyclase n=1 Tax=Rheinheimera baltica TaxID=67576 RepID=UPI00273E2970|nr:ligand-binding sensor domain-containing diguanylate cyclase [Rheinheimera baltica]MDP5151491.1 diguanylate cyclase [Rheinheimera baltica]